VIATSSRQSSSSRQPRSSTASMRGASCPSRKSSSRARSTPRPSARSWSCSIPARRPASGRSMPGGSTWRSARRSPRSASIC